MTEGEILKKLIDESEYSVQKFAELMGIQRQTLSPMFKMAFVPVEYKKKVASILNIDVAVFGQSQDAEYVKISKTALDAMEKLIKSMERHIDRLENK